MPGVSLRRASQIGNTIMKMIEAAKPEPPAEDDSYGRRRRTTAPKLAPLSAMVSIDIDTATAETIDDSRQDLLEARADLFALMDVYTRLRYEHAESNQQHGITLLVGERAMLLRKQKILTDMLRELVGGVYESDVFLTKLDAVKQRLGRVVSVSSPAYGEDTEARDRMVVPRLSAGDRDVLRFELAEINRKLGDVDDALIVRNLRNNVAISDEDWSILMREGIV